MSGEPAAGLERARFEAKLLLFAVIAATAVTVAQFAHCMAQGNCSFAEDFPVFYGPAHGMQSGVLASPYPVEAARAWLADPAAGFFHYSLYPPGSLLFFYPLGFLSYGAALSVWFALQLALLAASLAPAATRRLLLPIARPGQKRNPSPLILLFPFVTLCLLAGQIAMACAAFFALAFAWRRAHPVRSGLMLALLALKPQLALMLPVLLLAEGRIKPLLIAAVFTLVSQLAATGFFGTGIWRDYLNLLALSPPILALAPPQLLTVSLSPALGLRMLGLAPAACLYAQVLVSAAVFWLSWTRLRQSEDEAYKLLLITLSTFLVSPYMFHYDAVPLAFACLLLMRRWMDGTATGTQRINLILLVFIPLVAFKLQALHIPYGCIAVLAAYIGALRPPALLPATESL